MKDNIEHVEIEPEHCYIDFIGPPKVDGMSRTLKGKVRLLLSKPVKMRSIQIKFKGYGRICLKNSGGIVLDIETSLLPKIKAPLLVDNKKTFQLPAGSHSIPWELEIPNVYPRSLMIKRASIHYKVELAISLGIGKKAITAEYPIVILRHLLPCKELSPLIGTRVYRHTVPGKFHYEIDCPRIVCLEQGTLPISVKYLCITDQKPVVSIRTQLLQVEFYRCETIPKSDANLETSEKVVQHNIFGQRYADTMRTNPKCVKFTRRKASALIHSVEDNPTSAWKEAVVLRHELDELLTYGIESPIVTVYHQLEIVFQFGQKYDAVRAKVPLILTSLPYTKNNNDPTSPTNQASQIMYGTDGSDTIPKYRMETLPHFTPTRVTVDVKYSNTNNNGKENRRVSTATSSDDTSSSSSVAPDIAREKKIFMGVRERAISTSVSNSRASIMASSSRVGPGLQLSVAASSINLSTPYNQQQQSNTDNDKNNDTTNNHNDGSQSPSPSLSLSAFGETKSIRRCASATNLSITSRSASSVYPSFSPPHGQPPQRPTRSPMRRVLPNLAVNTALANSWNHSGPLSDDVISIASSSHYGSVASSEALPVVDRNLLRSKAMLMSRFESHNNNTSHYQQQQPPRYQQQMSLNNTATSSIPLSRAAPSSGINGRFNNSILSSLQQQQIREEVSRQPPTSTLSPTPSVPAFNRVVDPWLQVLSQEYENDTDEDVLYGDDEMSVSTMDGTSLSSVTTGSAPDDQLSLQSRPASPVYPPAPGLPGAIALRPQQASPIALVEETFACSPHSISANSIPYTVASSSVLSPRTSYALYRQRLTHAPPLPPPAIPLPEDPPIIATPSVRPSSTKSNTLTSEFNDNNNNKVRGDSYSKDVQNHYLRAELPPLPPSKEDEDEAKEYGEEEELFVRTGSRYFEDSDDESPNPVCTCPQHGHVMLIPPPHQQLSNKDQESESGPPPQLPRLSLGSTFSASLQLK
ncbi:hypothetical protein BDC45DRAFT_534738 [Circinella umbellata]|nr:hypothetical protein BDC45DRAFT_534738 [Circinella umbellata]